MAEPTHFPVAKRHTRPRWLRVSLIVVAIIVVPLVVLLLTGALGGGHGPRQLGPGRH